MENRAIALRYLSEAVQLDSNGDLPDAFAKYLQSIQALTVYLNQMYGLLGFQNMIKKSREIKNVLSMLHECSDRLAIVVDSQTDNTSIKTQKEDDPETILSKQDMHSSRFPAFEKLQKDNELLFKQYQWRLEKTNDKYMKTNLKLELERQIVENNILAKKQYKIAIDQLKRERAQEMEKELKKFIENSYSLNEAEREKQELYVSVINYAKTETWPCTWKLNSLEVSPFEAATKVFHRTIQSSDHPLSQWIIIAQTNIKREIDTALKKHTRYQDLLPRTTGEETIDLLDFYESADEIVFQSHNGVFNVSFDSLKTLQIYLETVSSELLSLIESSAQIFYVIYQTLLPDYSEDICYKLFENCVLEPIWKNLIMLYRISNMQAECKIAQIMNKKQSIINTCNLMDENTFCTLSKECNQHLKNCLNHKTVSEKLRIMVYLSQKLCNDSSSQTFEEKLGADDLIPLLCNIIMKSKLPQLSSECIAIEQLFDIKYMFGQEGYALSTFLTALKYIEMSSLANVDTEENKEK